MTVKQCSKCKRVLPAADFHVNHSRKGGLHSCCKGCRAAYYVDNIECFKQKRKRRYEANRVEACAAAKCWYEANRVRASARAKRWYEANKTKVIADTKSWSLEHPEQARQAKRAWKARNPELVLVATRRRRARQAGAEHNDLTQAQWQAALQAYGNMCAYSAVFAGHTSKLHQEHVVPLVRGGDHTLENIMPVCSGCNHSKGTKTAMEFLLDRL